MIDGPSSATAVHFGAIPYELAHLSRHCDLGAAGFSQTVLCTGAPACTAARRRSRRPG